MTSHASNFDSFNARFLSPERIAKTFVPPSQFDRVAERNNSLVVGPRGSGKTTPLKMLTPRALDAWREPLRSKILSKIDYVSAFVPADIAWQYEKDTLIGKDLAPEVREVIERGIVLNHVLSSLLDAFEICKERATPSFLPAHLEIQLSRHQEAELVGEIRQTMGISPGPPTLGSLASGFSRLLVELYTDASQLALRKMSVDEINERHGWIVKPLFPSISHFITVFESVTGKRGTRWAILFDEAENLPEVVRQELFRLLRGADDRILLKVSMAPVQEEIRAFVATDGPTANNDFALIPLWHGQKEKNYEFCDRLLKAMAEERGVADVGRLSVLDTSYFALGSLLQEAGLDEVYNPNSEVGRRFVQLAKVDPSFASYLERHKIDVSRLHKIKDKDRAQDVRKVLGVVTVRNAHLRMPGARRSRKTLALYTGAESLFAISEGNPRVFINLIRPLVEQFVQEGRRTVSRLRQARALKTVTGQYVELLDNIAADNAPNSTTSAFGFVDKIGVRMREQVLGPNFYAEPILQFSVDAAVPDATLQTIGRLINRGALIIVKENTSTFLRDGPRGLTLRLSYLLAPYFSLPLSLGKPRTLTFLMKVTADDPSGSLFDSE